MFDFEKSTLTLHGKELPVIKWEVWFMTPIGLSSTFKEAVDACVRLDILPTNGIVPIPVAIDSEDRYEIIMRKS